MKILVGNSGLIGETLKEKIKFDLEFNSKNIDSFNSLVVDDYDLYLSCLPATKWKVNQNIEEDLKNINNIFNMIKQKKYNKIILFSTIDVLCDSPLKSDENYKPNSTTLNYGTNRYFFELLVRQIKCNDLKIFRLPALFSKKIKKNVLYDLINKNNINEINVNSIFQWYNLDYLVNDINNFSINYKDEILFNLFTEPIFTTEILTLFPEVNYKELKFGNPIIYDYTTKFGGYISNKKDVLNDIKKLIYEFSDK